MSEASAFLARARDLYVEANAGTLGWMLDRRLLHGAFLNTKMNSLTLRDYDGEDGPRGPDILYGWIQGRGLEALASHAAFFSRERPEFAARLDDAGRRLYETLAALAPDGAHAFFRYDAALRPIRYEADGTSREQAQPPDIYTYSDIFVTKGLITAAARYAPDRLGGHLQTFTRLVAAIEHGAFQIDESVALTPRAIASQPDDLGPRMIVLGAAGVLRRLGLGAHAQYAERFIAHVLEHHFDGRTGLLCNVPGGDDCNVGHGIEFVGFALDALGMDADADLVAQLERILLASFDAGFVGPGLSLSLSLSSTHPPNSLCPWWSLPEAIRSAALVHARRGREASLNVWRRAHDAFFDNYWRGDPPVAYQMMTRAGPVDVVPATPDLDPGYHTGLSLLAAIETADTLLASDAHV